MDGSQQPGWPYVPPHAGFAPPMAAPNSAELAAYGFGQYQAAAYGAQQFAQPHHYAQPAAAQADQAGDFYRPRKRSRSRSPRGRSRSPRRSSRDKDSHRDGDRARGDRNRSRDRGQDRWKHDRHDAPEDDGQRDWEPREKRPPREKPKTTNEPSPFVIVQGLPSNYTDDEVRKVMEEYESGELEDVHVMRDRNTGESRGFAFAKFTSLDAAKRFVDANFPFIWVGGSRLRVDFSNRPSHSLAAVAAAAAAASNLAASIHIKPAVPLTGTSMYNDGTRDVGAVPNKVLLVRGLDALTTEELLFKKIQELAPEVKEVRNVRDRASNLASGFAFAELPSEELATALLKRLEEESLEVDGHRLLATYAHHGSFMPTHSYSQWSASSIVNAEGKKVYLQYWDENAYCSTFPSPPTPPEPANSKPKKKPTKKKDNIEDALSAFYADVPKAGAETGATPSAADAADALIQSVYAEMEAAEQQQQEPPSAKPSEAEAQPKEPKKTVLTIASKKASVNIQKWAAVSGSVDTDEDEEGGDEKAPELVVVPTQEEVNRTHVDLAINACLLCQRQFPSEDKLRKHQAASDLHKTNMEKYLATKREDAAKAEQARVQWKDRAAERRKAFNQPAKPPKPARHFTGPPKPSQPIVEEPTKNGIGGDNIGSQLLKKLGWKEGEGLGKSGGGIVEPVKAEGFARGGAGLGSGAMPQGHVNFEDYAQVTRDAWRKRAQQEF